MIPNELVTKANSDEKIVSKWKDTGLLQGLDKTKEKLCAKDLELAAFLVIYDKEENETVANTFFPVIRRLHSSSNKLKSPRKQTQKIICLDKLNLGQD